MHRNVHVYVLGSLTLLFSVNSLAESTPPPAFWEYLMEFSDDKGNVLDPIELDETKNLTRKVDDKTPADTDSAAARKERSL